MRANAPLSAECIEAYDVLLANGVDAPITDAPITAIFRTSADAERLLDELRRFSEAGQPVFGTELTGAALAERVPLASSAVAAGVQIDGQRFLDPGRFVTALGRAVVQRGGVLHILDVADVAPNGDGVAVTSRDGTTLTADAAVIASGAWLSRLAARWIRVPVRAGRGYSFSVPVDGPVTGPIYLPDARVACTPLNARLRISRHHGVRRSRRPDCPGPRRSHRRRRPTVARRCALGRAHRRVGGSTPRQPRWAAPGGEVCPRTVYVAAWARNVGHDARTGDGTIAGRADHHRQTIRRAARPRPLALTRSGR